MYPTNNLIRNPHPKSINGSLAYFLNYDVLKRPEAAFTFWTASMTYIYNSYVAVVSIKPNVRNPL